ncbi:hypothetical protein [Pararhodospirillum oryzae]|uniref:Uncharacterized protein n=1 Tax=Pararhodospirillum oryzae TaxID=478448 RepID=A0A512H814_9PROT|nr:hypothetical protein [Pararhodospirillum oryzae]GEO81606.1 hypothetical protein ROR02_17370 [Pararhodospirillum oryzae]
MPCPVSPATLLYRGSSKHKNRPADEQKGTLCPEWTHRTPAGGFATDPHAHDWAATPAAELFAGSVVDEASGRRYATARGIAFEAKPTLDGTWHGFPIPWESVPAAIKNTWLRSGAVTARQTKKYFRFDRNEIHWALATDDR